MAVYTCVDQLIAAMTRDGSGLDAMVPVQTSNPGCDGHDGDSLILSSQPKLMDINDLRGAHQLASLLDEVPLYQINMELLLDRILIERHNNAVITAALEAAFEGQPLPNTLRKDAVISADTLDGTLMHPMIGHLEKNVLAKIYINFMRALPHGHDAFAFETYIIGQHAGPFAERYDGFVCGATGLVKASLLIGFGQRVDFDPRQRPENYVESGRAQATLRRAARSRDLLLAWRDADNDQMRRTHDIDRMLTLPGMPRMPNWTRNDIFYCLEREAMKQVFAERLIDADPRLALLPTQTAIRTAIEASAKGEVDEALQQLLGQTLNTSTPYSGAARRFHDRAAERARAFSTLPDADRDETGPE